MPGTLTNLLYHVVFSTKQRKPLIAPAIKEELYRYIGGIIRANGGVLMEINGTNDHVHLLLKLKPNVCVSDVLRLIKANSSKWINEKKTASTRKFAWQDGYSAFTVSQSQLDRLTEYIRNQETHHRKSDFKAELLALLKRHNVEYDEQYLWD